MCSFNILINISVNDLHSFSFSFRGTSNLRIVDRFLKNQLIYLFSFSGQSAFHDQIYLLFNSLAMEFIVDENCSVDATVTAAVEEKLLQRMKQRADEVAQRSEQRKNEQTNRNTELETADAFLSSFNEMKGKLEEDLASVDALNEDKNAAMNKFDSILRDHGFIQQYLNESHMFLASFQVKKSQEILTQLEVDIHKKMEEIKPKKRFGFRAKAPKSAKPVVATLKTEDITDSSSKTSILDKILSDNFFGFKDKNDEELVMESSAIYNRQLNLQNLENCTVKVLGNPSTIQAANLTNCRVFIGPTMRSAFIKQCCNCTFVMACQQVRIHDTKDTEFYLHVTGAAIIESCSNVGFAPYNLEYSELQDHYLASGLDRNTNNWDKVEDFKWINEKEMSPNMYLIEENKRGKSWL